MLLSHHAFIVVITNAVKIICGLAVLKIAAIYLSVDDFGRFGQFMALTAIVNMLAGGAIGNGVVKLLSECKEPTFRHNIIASAGTFWLLSSVLMLMGLLLTKGWHESYLGNQSHIIIYLALAQVLWGQANFFNNYMVSCQDTCSIIICGLKANILGLLLFLFVFCYYQTLYAAMIGFLFFNSTLFLVSFYRVFSNNEIWFFYKPIISKLTIKKLSYYAFVLIVGATAIPLTQMYLRNHIGEVLGWSYVGYWQAVLRISDAHMQVFGVINLSVLLPYLSRLNSERMLNLSNKNIVNIFIAIVSVSILSSLILIVLKDWLIRILFSSDFSSIAPLVVLQTIGDFFKILLSLIVIICLAKGYWKIALCSELLQALILYATSITLLPYYESKALMLAYISSSLLSLLLISWLLWRKNENCISM